MYDILKRYYEGVAYLSWSRLFLAAALMMFTAAFYMDAKAFVAQTLLKYAFQASITDGSPHKPWQWADVYPVARLIYAKGNQDQIVLNSDSGEAMAFGPGRLPDWAPMEGMGTTILISHRDSHFAYLKDIQPGDLVHYQDIDGWQRTYRAEFAEVIAYDQARFIDDPTEPRLILVTCYPFEAIVPGGPLRYAVHFRAADITSTL